MDTFRSRHDDPALPVRAVLYGLAARLAAERRPAALRSALNAGEASWTLDSIVDLAGNRAIREALADLGPGRGSVSRAPGRRLAGEVLEHGTPRDLGRLVERHILVGPYPVGDREAA
jgi:hypothetical protein